MKQHKKKNSKMTLRKFIRALFSKDTPNYIKLIIGIAVAYTVFPVDALPDIFGPLGFADDAAIIGLLTTVAMTLLDNYNDHNKTVKTVPDAEEVDVCVKCYSGNSFCFLVNFSGKRKEGTLS